MTAPRETGGEGRGCVVYAVFWDGDGEEGYYATLAEARVAWRENLSREKAACGEHFNENTIRPIKRYRVAGVVSRKLACALLNKTGWCVSAEEVK